MADDPGTPHGHVALRGDVHGVVVTKRSRHRRAPDPRSRDVAEALPRPEYGTDRFDPADVAARGCADAVEGRHEVAAAESFGADPRAQRVADGERGLAERNRER